MKIIPMTIRDANEYVDKYHRHHSAVRICRFAIGCEKDGELVGVAICGRPLSRHLDDGLTIEINRLCTDGTRNACSMLYGACCRIAKEMGYQRAVTYILETENGASLKASNFVYDGMTKGEGWNRPSRPRTTSSPTCKKKRFVRELK